MTASTSATSTLTCALPSLAVRRGHRARMALCLAASGEMLSRSPKSLYDNHSSAM